MRLKAGNPVSYTHLDVYKRQIEEIPEAMKDDAELYHTELVEKICELDDELMMMYLEGEEPSIDELKMCIRDSLVADDKASNGQKVGWFEKGNIIKVPVSYTHLDVYKRQAFNEMMDELRELIRNKYESQILLNEMEIRFLQHQMNPDVYKRQCK